MTSFDVVVVGGGPAGAAVALQCRAAGLRVAIIEREAFPRHRPGETLPPGLEPLLAKLGVTRLNYPRFEGQWVAWGGALRFERFGADADGPWRGFQSWREDLDAQFLRETAAAGATVLQPRRATRPLQDCRTGVVGILTDRGPLPCRFVVDASGARHWLARHLALAFVHASPTLMATYGYAEGEMPNGPACLEADATGWTWIAQVKPGLAHWTRVNWTGQPQPLDWVPPPLGLLPRAARSRRADVTWRALTAPAGPGYFIVGDAAAVLDPASSHGVLRAVMSGMMAGHLIAQHIACGIPAEAISGEYTRWLAAWFAHDTVRLRELYAGLRSPPSWARRRAPDPVDPDGVFRFAQAIPEEDRSTAA